jgi:hypothetical protein
VECKAIKNPDEPKNSFPLVSCHVRYWLEIASVMSNVDAKYLRTKLTD